MIIYAAFQTLEHGDNLLEHYTGEEKDIIAYCKNNHNVGYGLKLTIVNPIAIPKDYAISIKQLLNERSMLEKKLADLNRKIKGNDVYSN